MASGGAATHDEAIDKEQDDGADDGAKEARGFSGAVPPDSLSEVSRDDGTGNA